MLEALTRNWWTLVLRGVIAILFGVLLFASPALTLGSLILFFGAFALVDGVFNTVGALFSIGKYDGWWVTLFGGLIGIGAGLLVMSWPGLTALAILWFVAFWAISTGVLQMIAAIRLRKDMEGEWVLGGAGALSTLFGVALILWPSAGILSLVWLMGLYATLFGVLLTFLGFRVRRANKTFHTLQSAMRGTRG